MADRERSAAIRKPRADAERNRLRLLATAKIVFAEKGSSASLDEIARIAGVGAGTLYRHFPNRDALVEAVYRNELDQLVAAADRLAETEPPLTALREWLLVFVDYAATKRAMLDLLNALDGGTSRLHSETAGQMKQAIAKLVARAVASGDVGRDLDPFDLLLALAGATKFASGPDGDQAARRLVDILIAGVRTGKR